MNDESHINELENAVCTSRYLGGVLNISPRRVRELAQDGTIPKVGRDKYPLWQCARAYMDFMRRGRGGNGGVMVPPEQLAPFQRKAWYQSENIRMQFIAECGELIERADMEQTQARTAKIVLGFLDKLPAELMDCGLTPAQAAAVEQHMVEVRKEFAPLDPGT